MVEFGEVYLFIRFADGAYVYAFGVAWSVGPSLCYGVHDFVVYAAFSAYPCEAFSLLF